MGDGVSTQVINEFLGEAEEIIETLNLDLVTLGDGAEIGEANPDLLNGIFRGAHSLKGLAGMFGFDDIGDLAHRMENLLDALRLGKIPLNGNLVETLFEGLEALTRQVNSKGGGGQACPDVTPLLDKFDQILNGDNAQTEDLITEACLSHEITSVLTEYEEHRLKENIKKGRTLLLVKASLDLVSFDQDLAEITEILKAEGEVVSTLPCAGDEPDRIGFQILLGTTESVGAIAGLLDRETVRVELASQSVDPSASQSELVFEEPPPAEPKPAPAPPSDAGVSASVRSISRTVRVDIGKLDSLMNIVGELVIAKGAIANLCECLKTSGGGEISAELQKATRTLERRLHELQNGVMEVRMVPVGQLFEKMGRIVRRVASEHGKKVTLDMRGADTELDKLIVEDLSDPLMHIIRNSVDHGIESAVERVEAGKPEKGTICLHASQKGNHVVIEVRDDGRGIDPDRVRRKAIEKGLVDPKADLSREQVFDLIFSPGFSTKDHVSDLSGRGVGMDVVKNNIALLSGMIELDSEVGEGTSMTITLPITLAIIKALIVKACGKTYAIPINSVMETLLIDASSVQTIERREVIELRNSTLPLTWLGDVFQLEGHSKDAESFFVAVVGLADKKMGLVVDDVVGQQDVVIKSLGNSLSFVRGVAGAADLGNQQTVLVLDVGGLMSEALRGESSFYV